MAIEGHASWPSGLATYLVERLQCEPELLSRPGVHFVVAHQPRPRVWHYAIPLWVMVLGQTGVVSSAPQLASAVRAALAGRALPDLLGDGAMASLQSVVLEWGPLDWFRRAMWLYCTPEMFRPRAQAAVVPVPADHPEGRALRERHRGEVFGVFRGHELISRSSIKVESDVAWEVAVATAELHRRQGLGASVVSRATEFIFAQGKLALYHCELTNEASRCLAESLGYRPFAHELAWSVDAVWAPRFWDGQAL